MKVYDMVGVSSSALILLREIGKGKNNFQTASADEAAILGINDAENLTPQQANAIKDGLEELERAGLIVVLFKSGAGFYSIDRITGQGRDVLRKMTN